MVQERYTKDGQTYVRINKGKARTLFNAGKTIYLLSEYMTFNSIWGGPCPVNNEQEGLAFIDFNDCIDNYKHYNCDKERGYLVKYFVKLKDL